MNRIVSKLKRFSFDEFSRELRWVWQYIKKYRFYVAFYVVLGLLSTASGLVGSVISKKLINAVTGKDASSIVLLAAFYVCFGLFSVAVNAVLSRLSAISATRVTQNIRQDVFSSVLCSKWQDLSAFHSGDLLNRVNNDVSTVATSVLSWLPTLVMRVLQFIGSFFLIFHYDKSMAFIALAGSPVTVAVSVFFMQRLRDNSKNVKKASSSLMSFLGETFREGTNIKAFGLTDNFKNRFEVVQNALTAATLEQNRFSVFSSAVISAFGMAVSYACFGWSVFRLWKGAIDFGTMVMFLQLASSLSSAFGSLVSLVPSAVNSAVAAGRVMEITELENEKSDFSKVEHLIEENKKDGIEVIMENVEFSYGKDSVLCGFSLCARPGEIVALSGRSGAGKTTILRLLLGLAKPQSGKNALIGCENKKELEISSQTRKAFSYVPQGHSLLSGSIRDNLLMLCGNASQEQIESALKAACAFDFVMKLPKKLETVLGEDNLGLSEGQAQRIAIARAVLSPAPVMIFDEATSAIDDSTQKTILENIRNLPKEKTIIMTTHKRTVLDFCDKIYKVGTVDEK